MAYGFFFKVIFIKMLSVSVFNLNFCFQTTNLPMGTPHFKGANTILPKSDKPIFKGNEVTNSLGEVVKILSLHVRL